MTARMNSCERRTNLMLVRQVELQNDSLRIGRFALQPGKGYRVNKWRRIVRAIVRALT